MKKATLKKKKKKKDWLEHDLVEIFRVFFTLYIYIYTHTYIG